VSHHSNPQAISHRDPATQRALRALAEIVDQRGPVRSSHLRRTGHVLALSAADPAFHREAERAGFTISRHYDGGWEISR
jgi:hypothetical protein